MKKAYFAGGCFWCIEPIYRIFGVDRVVAGYSGGSEPDPGYREVKAQKTGHRETVMLEYDPEAVTYDTLLEIYFANVDPFDGGGQFIDRGFSYTLAVFYTSEEEKEKAEAYIRALEEESGRKAYVSVEAFTSFYEAEEEHQDYDLKHPEALEEELISSGRKAPNPRSEAVMIRNAEEKDIPKMLELLSEILELHAAIRPDVFISGTTKYTEEDLKALFRDENRRFYVAADADDKVIGYAICVLKKQPFSNNMVPFTSLFIDDLCVDEQSRGKHVGKALFDHVVSEAKALGCYEVTLNVWEGNDAARAFYDRMGMRPKETQMELILDR